MAERVRRLGLMMMAMIVAVDASSAGAEPTKERQAALIHRLEHDCGSCHGMTLNGGLGPPLLPDALAGRSDEELVEVILFGRPGTPMPPWHFEISEKEAAWLVRQLKDGLGDAR